MKALNSAIEIRNKFKEISSNKNLPTPLELHIGINTGIVLAGSIGGEDDKSYTVMGDTVNLASRLEDKAVSSQILVGPSTYRATRNDFEYRELPPVELKGKKEPVHVFEVLSMKEKIHRPRFGFDRTIHSRLVGRDKELNKLKLQVMKVINGEGSIVNVIGEGGIGKSRLLAELKNKEEIRQVRLMEGRAISMGRNLSFYPIIDMFKSRAGIEESDNETIAFGKLEALIRNVNPDEANEIIPFVATLMGMNLTGKYAERIKGIEGEALEKLILKNTKDYLAKEAESKPLLIYMEDLHWAVTSSIELLGSLFRLVENNPILFINVFRPGYEETSDLIISTIIDKYPDYNVDINLEPLSEKSGEELLDGLLNISNFPIKLRTQIIEKSTGNPFFIEEIVRSMIDEGAITQKNNKYQVTDKIESITIPPTIQEVLMGRIDRLDTETKDLIKTASVIGRGFFHKILTEVIESKDDIDSSLGFLKDIQLIKERTRLEELEYLFKHALAQEAAYGSILLKKRQEVHLKVANSIEAVFGERLHEFYGMLAYHFSKGGDLEKAEEYLMKAGEEAMKSAASSEAIEYFQEALSMYLKIQKDSVDPKKIALLQKKIGLSFLSRGCLPEAIDYFNRALSNYGIKEPESGIAFHTKLFASFSSMIFHLYFPIQMKRRYPTPAICEVIELTVRKLSALIMVDSRRCFFEMLFLMKKLNQYNLQQVEGASSYFFKFSVIFSYSGLSLKLSRKLQEYARSVMTEDDLEARCNYDLSEIFYDLSNGSLGRKYLNIETGDLSKKYNSKLVDFYYRNGNVIELSTYLALYSVISHEMGYFSATQELIDVINKIAEDYNNDYARIHRNQEIIRFCDKRSDYNGILNIVDSYIKFAEKSGYAGDWICSLYLLKFKAQLKLNKLSGLDLLLQKTSVYFNNEQSTPIFRVQFYSIHLLYEITIFENSITNESKQQKNKRFKKAEKFVKIIKKNAKKTGADRTEAYRLIATYYWLIKKKTKGSTLVELINQKW